MKTLVITMRTVLVVSVVDVDAVQPSQVEDLKFISQKVHMMKLTLIQLKFLMTVLIMKMQMTLIVIVWIRTVQAYTV